MAEATYVPRLKKKYAEEIHPRLQKELGYKNPMQVPRVTKIVLNMGVAKRSTTPRR
jgi:large subunit ribosomal protein L5